MDEETIERIPGAAELAKWFGRFPSFHDGHLTNLSIAVDGSGFMKLEGFETTDRTDANGFFIHEKHFTCTVTFDGASSVDLSAFQPGSAILFELEISHQEDEFEITFGSSYGVEGRIRAAKLRIEFEPQIRAKSGQA